MSLTRCFVLSNPLEFFESWCYLKSLWPSSEMRKKRISQRALNMKSNARREGGKLFWLGTAGISIMLLKRRGIWLISNDICSTICVQFNSNSSKNCFAPILCWNFSNRRRNLTKFLKANTDSSYQYLQFYYYHFRQLLLNFIVSAIIIWTIESYIKYR